MNGPGYVLALDQGTTSSRAILFDQAGQPVAMAAREFPQLYPAPGAVEHDPEAIWSSQLGVAQEVLRASGVTAAQVAGLGVTNQRETTLVWERETGRPVHNAIVWQSRVTAAYCDELRARGLEPLIRGRTGLPLDAYFSGPKIHHLLASRPGLTERAARGELLFGTVDSFLIWRLTEGAVHVTDASNASRTLLFDIHRMAWDDELLAAMDVPRAMLPRVVSSSERYGTTAPGLFGGPITIAGDAGDQQAATFGQACFGQGLAKQTYGTGAFLLMNTGSTPVTSRHGLLTTVAWRLGDRVTYALEGSIFIAGAGVQWLRDGLGLIERSSDVERLASRVPDTDGVYVVPAFVGLGAPYWDPYARGTIVGLTRGSTGAHIARATVDAIAYQTRDVVEAMIADAGAPLAELRVDGGAAANDRLLQFQADLLRVPVARPRVAETTALGAAYLAGLAVGFWQDTAELATHWALDRRFVPGPAAAEGDRLYAGWQKAVARSRGWVAPA
ncbi:MAG: glycerol kinase GlpK [Candidatus Limnocylindrales bacterium]